MDAATERKLIDVLSSLEKLPNTTEALVLAHRRLSDEVQANGRLVQTTQNTLNEVQSEVKRLADRLGELEGQQKITNAQCILKHEEINSWRKTVDGDLTDSKIHDRTELMAKVEEYRQNQLESQKLQMEAQKQQNMFRLESWKVWLAVAALVLGGSGGGAVAQRIISVMFPAPQPSYEAPKPVHSMEGRHVKQ